MQGAQVQSLAGKLRSRMLQVQKRKGNFKKEDEEEKEREKKTELGVQDSSDQNLYSISPHPDFRCLAWVQRTYFKGIFLSLSFFFFPSSLPFFFLFIYLFFKITQSCPTLCDPTDYTVHGILQAGILEWVAVPFSRGSSQPQVLNPGLPHCR